MEARVFRATKFGLTHHFFRKYLNMSGPNNLSMPNNKSRSHMMFILFKKNKTNVSKGNRMLQNVTLKNNENDPNARYGDKRIMYNVGYGG